MIEDVRVRPTPNGIELDTLIREMAPTVLTELRVEEHTGNALPCTSGDTGYSLALASEASVLASDESIVVVDQTEDGDEGIIETIAYATINTCSGNDVAGVVFRPQIPLAVDAVTSFELAIPSVDVRHRRVRAPDGSDYEVGLSKTWFADYEAIGGSDGDPSILVIEASSSDGTCYRHIVDLSTRSFGELAESSGHACAAR